MEMLKSYLDYRKHKPEYKPFKEEREDKEAKRLAYIKNKGVSEAQKKEDIERAKAVLNAVDIMDEYSQTRAEDMEVVVQGATNAVTQLTSIPGMIAGFLLALSKPVSNKFGDKALMILPIVGSLLGPLVASPFLAQWGAKKEVGASRNGRFEAMQKDLSSAKQFAVLDETQEKQLEDIAKNIKIDKKEAKKLTMANKGAIGMFQAIRELTSEEDAEIVKTRKEFKEKLKQDELKSKSTKLSEKEIEEAKKDQQLIQNVVEKIDIASQDYAENIELVTSAIETVAIGGGGLIGIGLKALLSKTKMSQGKQGIISTVAGFAIALAFIMYATKLQKQGSRIARFKTKQDFLNNPEKLVYVDDEKAKNENGENFKNKENKQGFFSFLSQAIKDNKEYNEYLKNENIVQKQKQKAREEITLTPEQEKRAHQLQQNTFKMFNKLDEKSQSYAENAEALGEIVKMGGGTLAGLFMMTGVGKMLKTAEEASMQMLEGQEVKTTLRVMKPMLKKLALSAPFLILLNIFITKEQKQASRVANMLAINEMSDYKNFADYSDKTAGDKVELSNNKKENTQTQTKKNVFSSFKK